MKIEPRMYEEAMEDVIMELKATPTVCAEPITHARWIEFPECLKFEGAYSKDHIACGACHHVWSIMDNDTDTFDYCPHCGAKMDLQW